MGVRFPSVNVAQNFGNVNTQNTLETLIYTTPGLNISLDFATILLFWWMLYNPGASTTAATVRIRRGAGITGTLVDLGLTVPAVVAGTKINLSGCYVDTPGAVAAQQYSLTIQQTAGTGAGAVNDGMLIAFAL